MFTVLYNFASFVKENAKLRRNNSFDLTEVGFTCIKNSVGYILGTKPASLVSYKLYLFINETL